MPLHATPQPLPLGYSALAERLDDDGFQVRPSPPAFRAVGPRCCTACAHRCKLTEARRAAASLRLLLCQGGVGVLHAPGLWLKPPLHVRPTAALTAPHICIRMPCATPLHTAAVSRCPYPNFPPCAVHHRRLHIADAAGQGVLRIERPFRCGVPHSPSPALLPSLPPPRHARLSALPARSPPLARTF